MSRRRLDNRRFFLGEFCFAAEEGAARANQVFLISQGRVVFRTVRPEEPALFTDKSIGYAHLKPLNY